MHAAAREHRRQHGGLIARAGAHFQHGVGGGQLQQLGHQGDDGGLADGLVQADGQGPVLPGVRAQFRRDELVARHGQQRGGHRDRQIRRCRSCRRSSATSRSDLRQQLAAGVGVGSVPDAPDDPDDSVATAATAIVRPIANENPPISEPPARDAGNLTDRSPAGIACAASGGDTEPGGRDLVATAPIPRPGGQHAQSHQHDRHPWCGSDPGRRYGRHGADRQAAGGSGRRVLLVPGSRFPAVERRRTGRVRLRRR